MQVGWLGDDGLRSPGGSFPLVFVLGGAVPSVAGRTWTSPAGAGSRQSHSTVLPLLPPLRSGRQGPEL